MGKRAQKSRDARGRGSVGGAERALPALSSLTDLPRWGELSPSERQRMEFGGLRERLAGELSLDASELALGCVVRLDRGFPAVLSERGVLRAEFAARLSKAGYSRVAVGDWVCLRLPAGHDMGLVCEILSRESDVARWKGKSRGERQTLAANVDVVLVVQALGDEPVSCDRIARSAVIAADCGCEVAVVLTKADRAGESGLRRDLGLVRELLGEGVGLVATSSDASAQGLEAEAVELGAGWGEAAVRALVPEGRVAIVLGESGAGKSTLLNALLGRAVLETGAVRSSDDSGRHTTVARRMVSLPGAGVIVDEPGLRSLPLVGHEHGLARVFPEVSEAAQGCRFRDCSHTHEPACGVRAARLDGSCGPVRVDAYVSLAREMRASAQSLDPDIVL